MKKLNFEKLSGNDLFLAFASKKLSVGITSAISGGRVGDDNSATALCVTAHSNGDSDSAQSQEDLSDKRCGGGTNPPPTPPAN